MTMFTLITTTALLDISIVIVGCAIGWLTWSVSCDADDDCSETAGQT